MASTTQYSLPMVVQDRICYYLCPHCYNSTLGLNVRNRLGRWQETRALAALCATSRSWNAAARPYLYHVLDIPARRGRCGDLPWHDLARTLLHNRDLARYVTTFDQEAAHGLQSWTEVVNDPVSFGFLDKRGPQVGLLPLILACANRLRHLKLDIVDGYECWDNQQWRSLLLRLHSMGLFGSEAMPEPQPLSQIKTLTIMSRYDWGFEIDSDIVYTMIQGAGPSLEHLEISNVKGSGGNNNGDLMDDIQTPHLRVLTFSGAAFEQADTQATQLIERLCQTSGCLEEFHYRGKSAFIGENMNQPATAADLVTSLLASRKTVRVLSLDLSRFAWHMGQGACLALLEASSSLKDFTKLQKLSLEDFSFCLHRHELDEKQRQTIPPTCLTSSLPASIRHLFLRVAYTEPNERGESSDRGVWDDIMEIARQAAIKDGPFPDLRQIEVIASVEEGVYRGYIKNPEDPATIWMAAELQRRTKTLEMLCQGTDVEYSIKRGHDW